MTRLRSWLLLGPATALAGLILFVIASPRAGRAAQEGLDEPGDPARTHIVMVCPPAERCKARGIPVSKVACEMDVRGVAMVVASGTRTRCDRVAKP